MKYSLRSLMTVVLVLPPLLAGVVTLAAWFWTEAQYFEQWPDSSVPAAHPPKP
jgi:hypothetical protein